MFSKAAILAGILTACVATAACGLAWADETPAHRDPRHAAAGLVGASLFLPFIDHLFGLALSYQATSWLELQAGAATSVYLPPLPTPNPRHSFSYTQWAGQVRGRLWPMGRHNVVAEVGARLNHHGYDLDEQDAAGNSFHYHRAVTGPTVFTGGGYGLRGDRGFRLTVVVGYEQFLGSLPPAAVTTTGAYKDAESAGELHNRVTASWAALKVYTEFSIGWMF